MKKFICAIGLLIALQTGAVFGLAIGGEALDMYAVGVAASDLGLAEATAAQQENHFGAFYNPATLAKTEQSYLYSLQGKLTEQADLFAITSLFKIANLPVSVTWTQIQSQAIPLVTSDNVNANVDIDPDGFGRYSAMGILGATAISLSPTWRFGLSVLGYAKSLTGVENGHAYGYSLTPGISGILSDSLNVGMYFRNLISQERWESGHQNSFLPEWHTGFVYTLAPASVFAHWVALPKSGYQGHARLGIAIAFGKTLFLRGGYQDSHCNVGIGLHVGPAKVDYVFIGTSNERFGESSRFSIGVAL